MHDIVEAPLLVTVKDAARPLGITPWACWQLCELGELESGYPRPTAAHLARVDVCSAAVGVATATLRAAMTRPPRRRGPLPAPWSYGTVAT